MSSTNDSPQRLPSRQGNIERHELAQDVAGYVTFLESQAMVNPAARKMLDRIEAIFERPEDEP